MIPEASLLVVWEINLKKLTINSLMDTWRKLLFFIAQRVFWTQVVIMVFLQWIELFWKSHPEICNFTAKRLHFCCKIRGLKRPNFIKKFAVLLQTYNWMHPYCQLSVRSAINVRRILHLLSTSKFAQTRVDLKNIFFPPWNSRLWNISNSLIVNRR